MNPSISHTRIEQSLEKIKQLISNNTYGHFPIQYILYGHFIPYGHFPLWTLFHMDILPYGQFADSPSKETLKFSFLVSIFTVEKFTKNKSISIELRYLTIYS
jgi:hypothetical protein